MKYLNRHRAHSFSHNIFTMNLHEIQEGLKIIENPDIGIKLFSVDNRAAGDQAFREVNRLFHNFLASAKTLIDHTRIFMNKHYSGTPAHKGYKQKIKNEYENNELCRFIQDLRNYILHRGLPHTEMTLSADSEGPIESTINLDVKKMQSWSKWTSQSKSFLSKSEKKIKMSTLVNEYADKIGCLHEWLNNKLRKHHKKDIKELESMQRKYSNTYEKA